MCCVSPTCSLTLYISTLLGGAMLYEVLGMHKKTGHVAACPYRDSFIADSFMAHSIAGSSTASVPGQMHRAMGQAGHAGRAVHTIHELQSSIAACLQDGVHVLIALHANHTASLALLLCMRQGCPTATSTNWVCTENRSDALGAKIVALAPWLWASPAECACPLQPLPEPTSGAWRLAMGCRQHVHSHLPVPPRSCRIQQHLLLPRPL